MITTVHIELSAAHPNLKLGPFACFKGSAVSATITDVPKAIGLRTITGVNLVATNVDGEAVCVAAARVGSAWSATIQPEHFGESGTVLNGIKIEAVGTDETGAAVDPWKLGVGDIQVLEDDGTIAPGEKRQACYWYGTTQPEKAVKGAMYYDTPSETIYIYNGYRWISLQQVNADWNATSGKAKILNKPTLADGAARPLPKYLHALAFDDVYKADAEAFYEEIAGDTGAFGCSAMVRGGKLYRNYDWIFDDAAEFVVKVSGNTAAGRFASVGVASLGAALTEAEVTSGKWSAKYRALPGMTLDGINEKGVVAEINVDGGPKTGWHGDADDEGIHILAAVRWVLDHGETAEQAAEWIADHVIQPTGDTNFHFMVADKDATYIVENGEAHLLGETDDKVLTNYALYDAAHAGGGIERLELLAGGAEIEAAHWTNAYQSGNTWDSDFDSAAQHAAAIVQWAAQGATKEAHRGKTTTGGSPWWQTVHTSVYDFAAKTLKVAVQESTDWYVFAIPASGTGGGEVNPKKSFREYLPGEETDFFCTTNFDVGGIVTAAMTTMENAGCYIFVNPEGFVFEPGRESVVFIANSVGECSGTLGFSGLFGANDWVFVNVNGEKRTAYGYELEYLNVDFLSYENKEVVLRELYTFGGSNVYEIKITDMAI